MPITKLIVLDRDGVINIDSDAYIKSAEEWQPETGAIEAIVKLKQANWVVVVATNQSGIKRGLYNRTSLSQMHQKLQGLLLDCGGINCLVDWISYSPYLASDNTQCRKPNTGMLTAIEKRFNVSLQNCPFVGDTINDVYAAQQKKMNPILVLTGKGKRTVAKYESDNKLNLMLKTIPTYSNLQQAAEAILK